MSFPRSTARSPYMEWAKLCSTAKFNLAPSGVGNYALAQLGISNDQLEINGEDTYGYKPLIEAIAARYGVPTDCVMTAAGTSMANYLALAATTEPGDEILLEQPTYELLLSTARYLSLEVKRFPRPAASAFQPDIRELERKLSKKTRLVVLANLHNPSGALISNDVLRAMGNAAKKVGARVLVDEVYLELLFDAGRTAFHLDPECLIVTNSLTKGYGLSGLRCGWVLAAPALVERMWRINDLHAATPVFPGEQISVVAFQKLEQIAARAERLLKVNRQLLRKFLESRDHLEYFWPEYGTIVFPRFRPGNADELCSFLREKFQTTVVPGRFFEAPDHFRIGVGGETESVRSALEQLGRGLDEFARGR